MTKNSNKRFVLVNIPASTTEEDISFLFENIKPLSRVTIGNIPNAKNRRFAYIFFKEEVQPYYLLAFSEKIRLAKLNGNPITLFPIFLNQPVEVSKLYNHICHLMAASDFETRRKAEAVTNDLSRLGKKLRQVGIEDLLQILSNVTSQNEIDLALAEAQINEIAALKVAESKRRPKTAKKKKRNKKRNNSVVIISTPMGGQPGWKRK
jgi:RNA recognition motif-containing protein